jgi:hypothetical protein
VLPAKRPVEPPHTSPRLTAAHLQLAAKVLRRQQWTCGQNGAALEVSAATVARVLRRCGLSRRGRLTAPLLTQRYEHAAVGDLLHVDSKKLGRIRGLGHRITGQRFHQFSGAGSEYLQVAVDENSRVAYVELLPDEGQVAARRFLRGALCWFRAHGVRVRRLLTDNGSAYRSRSFAACRSLRVSHRHSPLHAAHERHGPTGGLTPRPIAAASSRAGWSPTIARARIRVSTGSHP